MAGLWLSACAHTGSPKPAKPEQEKPAQNTSESRTAPPETTDSNQQEAREKSQTSQPPSQSETGPESKNTAENRPASETNSADAANAKLKEARENLQTSRETEKRIAAEIEQLKNSGNASAETVKDYEDYLARVRAMTAENRKILEQMETAYNRHSPDATNSNTAVPNEPDRMYDPSIPEEQAVDEVAALDKEFNESLAQFDEKLLKEMDAIRAGSTKKLQDLAQEAAEAAKRLRDKGVDVDTSGAKSSEETDTQKEASESGRETETTGGGADTKTASRDGSGKAGKGTPADDRRRANYEDDDIVARQLREAAENETDPELKEKLWQEYEEYKKNSWLTGHFWAALNAVAKTEASANKITLQ